MWNRTNRALSLLLGVQLALFGLLFAFCGPDRSDRIAPRVLFEGLALEQLTELRLQAGEPDWGADPASGPGAELVLAREADGWVLPAKAGYPADKAKVERILGQLLGLQTALLVASGPEHLEDLEVGQAKFRRKLTLVAGGQSRTLFVGGRKAGFTQVRLGDERDVYGVDDLDEWQLGATATDWLDKGTELAPRERVARLEVERGGKDVRLDRVGPAAWRLVEQPVPAGKVEELLAQAMRLEPQDVLGRLDDPAVKARIDQGKDPVVVRVGLRAEPWPAPGAAPGEVPDPVPIAPGAVPGEAAGAAPVEIVEQQVLHFATHPDKTTQVLAYQEGARFAVVVDRWRVERLLDLDPIALLKPAPFPGPDEESALPGLPGE